MTGCVRGFDGLHDSCTLPLDPILGISNNKYFESYLTITLGFQPGVDITTGLGIGQVQ
eukprot:jgi/Bigna1/60757/fgenesh1_kg.14_\